MLICLKNFILGDGMFFKNNLNKNKILSFCSMGKKTKKEDKASTSSSTNSGPVFVNKNGSVTINILAKPGCKINGITGIDDEGIGVQISAPPVEGEANTELIKYLSSVLGVKKSSVSLDRGSRSRQKKIIVSESGLSQEDILNKIKACINT